jgi:hypothetical protein
MSFVSKPVSMTRKAIIECTYKEEQRNLEGFLPEKGYRYFKNSGIFIIKKVGLNIFQSVKFDI